MSNFKVPTSVINELDKEILAYQQHVNGLLLARSALAGTSPSPARRSRKGGGNRTAMITKILQTANEPMTVNEILAALAAEGRTDERKLVAASLPYLKRQNIAKTVERGKWVAISTHTPKPKGVSVAEETQKAA